ncbi:hypothetical protein ACFL1H_02900, partial [Nanoarchaeota archaeon]
YKLFNFELNHYFQGDESYFYRIAHDMDQDLREHKWDGLNKQIVIMTHLNRDVEIYKNLVQSAGADQFKQFIWEF